MEGSLIQRSFAGGELAPSLYGRADQVKYQTGLRTCRNFLIRRHGGASNRSGTQFICEMKTSTLFHKAKKFVFNNDQTYVLLFGDRNMRVVRQGVLLTVSGVVPWSGATAYNVGAVVVSGGTNYYCILAHTNNVPPNATYWYAMPAGNIYEIPTPYVAADVATLYLAQSGDVISIDHQNYAPMDLRRTGHTSWTLIASVFQPAQPRPVGATAIAGVAGSKTWRYRITALTDGSGEESLPAWGPPKTISGISQANPCVVTSTNHQLVNGDEVYIDGIVGMTQLNGLTFKIAGVLTNTFQLVGIDSRTYGLYLSGGTVSRTSASTTTMAAASTITAATQALPCQITTAAAHGLLTGNSVYITGIVGMTQLNGGTFTCTVVNPTTVTLDGIDSTLYTAYASGGTIQNTTPSTGGDPTSANPNTLSWTQVPGATGYNIYREIDSNGVYGFLGSAVGTAFNDTNGVKPNPQQTPPLKRTPFNSAGNYPATVGYFNQRRFHGNTLNASETIFGSKAGFYTNYTISSPLEASDAVTYTVSGKQVNQVRHLIDIGNLVILTSGGEWVAQGDGNGVLTPSTPGMKQYSYNGSSVIPPIIVGSNLLYIQARGNMVRDFRNTITQQGTQGYLGDDLTVFASHLFEGFTLSYWDYQQIPHSIAWAVRSDGVLLGLTYLKEHEISAWHHHDTLGAYEDVCVVPEGGEDMVYVIVRRTIQGVTRRYLERFSSRFVSDITVDAHFLDAYLTFDGRNVSATTMTLTGGTLWDNSEQLTLTASAAFFAASDVGNGIVLSLATTTITPEQTTTSTVSVLLLIEAYTSATVVLVRPVALVDATLRAVALTSWSKAVKSVSGLDHLEGQVVGVLADGHVVTNGLDTPLTVVTGGAITLDRPYSVIHAGLPYVSDLEVLDLEVVNGETLADKRKRVISVVLTLESTRGLSAGETVTELFELPPDLPDYGLAIAPVTDKRELMIRSTWNMGGRVFVRQRNPLPATILSIMPRVDVGG